jgi:hypothetical protein
MKANLSKQVQTFSDFFNHHGYKDEQHPTSEGVFFGVNKDDL